MRGGGAENEEEYILPRYYEQVTKHIFWKERRRKPVLMTVITLSRPSK
jgi:hypothetical protein